jgi:predicted amidohydrolase YtcJ
MKKLNLIILTLIVLIMTACNTKTHVDLLLLGGKIYTVDSSFTTAEAMAVKDGKILKTGTDEALKALYTAKQEINLNGDCVYPGFIDGHCHFYGLGLTLQEADLKGATSFENVIERLKVHNETFKPLWLLGDGWDQNLWPVKEFPDNTLLNQAFPDVPVVLTRIDGHAVIANQKALDMASMTVKTKIPGGKLILKDGKLTGVLMDKAVDSMENHIPKPKGQELEKMLLQAQKECLAMGLTTVADAGLSKNIVLLMDRMQKNDSLKLRVYAMLDPSKENIEYFIKKGVYKTPRLHVCSIKLYADGALGSRGGCLLKPYSDDPSNSGIMVETPEKLSGIIAIAYQYGYQVNTHAIGDSANRMVLDLYAGFLKQKNDRRWRIEHCQCVDPSDFIKFQQYSIIPSVQPTHATSDMNWADERLGPERIKFAYAYKKLLEQNGWIAFGTDFPIEKVDPLLTFFAAVCRKDAKGYPPEGFQMENAVSRTEALKAMTIWAARSCFEEKEKGSLEAGKYADFVILDKDITKVAETELLKVRVLETYINGEKVFGNRGGEK